MKIKIGVAVTVFLALIFIVFPDWFQPFEYRAQDAIFQRRGRVHPNISILGIDDAALDLHGQWPWPRSYIADAIHILNSNENLRPSVIAIDILFSEPSRIPGDDDALLEAVRNADNVLLASRFRFGIDRETLNPTPIFIGIDNPIPELLPYVRTGHMNGVPDNDGVVRNISLWETFNGEVHYSFPLMIALTHTNSDEPHDFIQENKSMYLRYTGYPEYLRGAGDYFSASLAEIFQPNFNPARFAGNIVLIGPYAAGMMDIHPVPISRHANMHGVEIHANAVQAILDEAFKQRAPAWVGLIILAAILILGMTAGQFLDTRVTIASFAVIGAAYFFAAQHIYFNFNWLLPILTPLVLLSVIAIHQLIFGYVSQILEKNKMRRNFGKYVDPALVNSLINSGEADTNTVGQRKHIAVLFVDIRGFTPMSESLRDTPEIIVETLNDYLELTTNSVFANGGSVDKFIGDATMALFNGFVPLEDYIYKAVKAAWDMVNGAEAVNASIKERFGIDIGFGVGVHCGDAIVGNLGPAFRKDYTAIGDAVNTAARLESQAKHSQVLLSRDIIELLQDRIKTEPLGEIQLKGKSAPLEVFRLVGVE